MLTYTQMIDKYEDMKYNARMKYKEAEKNGDEKEIQKAFEQYDIIRKMYRDLRIMK
jgi:hypothetical protein